MKKAVFFIRLFFRCFPFSRRKSKNVGYVPGVQKKRGYVPRAKRANRHGAVDMFPRTGTGNDYLIHFLGRRRDCLFTNT